MNGKVFASTDVNTGRQQELDLARAVMILCLPFIHCIIECSTDEELLSGIPFLFDTIIGGPLSAPLYMFVMGIGITYSKKSSWKQHLNRGILLIIASYLLNVFRYTLPFLLGYALTGDYSNYITVLPYYTFMNDILLFAGLAMVVIALMIRFHVNDLVMLIIGVVCSLVSTLIGTVDVGSPVGNILLGYLIGTEDTAEMVMSDFPLLCWLIVPVTGYLFGKMLHRVKDKGAFYLRLSLPCLIFAVLYFAWGIHTRVGMFGEGQNCYYHISTMDALASMITVMGLFGLYYLLLHFLPKFIEKAAHDISSNISAFYMIHWVLISLSIKVVIYALLGTQEIPLRITLLIALIIDVISALLAHSYGLIRKEARIYAKTQAD